MTSISCHTLTRVISVLVANACLPHSSLLPDPDIRCPQAGDLASAVQSASVVARGKVTYDQDCLPPTMYGSEPFFDCVGRRADLVVSRVWKGPLNAGDGIRLFMPGPLDSAGLLLRKGDEVLLFVRLTSDEPFGRTYSAYTDACMLPVGFGSVTKLAAALDSLGQVRRSSMWVPPNQRLKLTARGGRSVVNGSVLSAAAAGRSLSAIR